MTTDWKSSVVQKESTALEKPMAQIANLTLL